MTHQPNFKKTICIISKKDCHEDTCIGCNTYKLDCIENFSLREKLILGEKTFLSNKNQTIIKGTTDDVEYLLKHFEIVNEKSSIINTKTINEFYPEWIEARRTLHLDEPTQCIYEADKPLFVFYDSNEIYCIAPRVIVIPENHETEI